MSSHYQKAVFLLSAADVKQMPPDEGIEVAIVGRSNSGKSSVLNCLTKNKKLARVSKTPGRTQLINTFGLDDERRLIDLPGYGYAKVPIAAKKKWQLAIDKYFQVRMSLKGLVLIMDIRHPLKDLDWALLDFAEQSDLAVHIILNKADKISRGAAAKTLQAVKAALTEYNNPVTFQIFSALKGAGLPDLFAVLDDWYGYKK
jgi:GTP-binding protein